ncbi:hypothetical protein [Cupriavidus basilensis]
MLETVIGMAMWMIAAKLLFALFSEFPISRVTDGHGVQRGLELASLIRRH